MKRFSISVYVVIGIGAIAVGILAFVRPFGTTVEEMHLGRELGAASIFVGLMSLWCARHFEARREVHIALVVFALLNAAIHWADVVHGTRPLSSGVVNSILPAVLLAIWPRRA